MLRDAPGEEYPFYVPWIDEKPSRIPRDYEGNLRWRASMLQRASKDRTFQAELRKLFFEDIIFAFNAFFWTYDVRKRPFQNRPFVTYPYQEKAILELQDCITHKRDLPFEKSRDMGVSWLVLGVFFWNWLQPTGGGDFLLGSRIEDYVDKKGDMRTLMEKIRYLIQHLPKWLLPRGWNRKEHDNYLRIINPETRASITGESNNANFGTGGRYAAMLFDEFAKWENTDVAAWTSAGDATPCRVAVSTPFGASGQYYDIISAVQRRKITLFWYLHPEKSQGLYCQWPPTKETKGHLRSPWYDAECDRRSKAEIAQELDINYLGSGSPVFQDKAAERIAYLLALPAPKPHSFYAHLGEGRLSLETLEPRSFEDYLILYQAPSLEPMVAGVDVAEGKENGDFSIIKLFTRSNPTLVASYYGKADEHFLAKILIELVRLFPRTTYAIETTGPGLATFDAVITEPDDVPGDAFMMPIFDRTKQQISYVKGWKTTKSSKWTAISALKDFLSTGEGWLDTRAIGECLTFVHSPTGAPKARPGRNDDEVMASGIALAVINALGPEETLPKGAQVLGASHPPRASSSPGEASPLSQAPNELAALCAAQAAKSLALRQAYELPLRGSDHGLISATEDLYSI